MLPLRGGLAPLTLPSKTTAGNGLLTNLVAYWGFDEAGGANNALDKHSNGLTLTQAGSPGSATGLVYAGARTITANSMSFSRASETLLETGAVDWALAIWIYPTEAAARTIVTKVRGADGVGEYQVFRNANRTILYSIWQPSAHSITSTATTADNQWSLVLVQHSATTKKTTIYINNDSGKESAAYAGTPITSAQKFSVGDYADNYSGGFYTWRGRMGPISFWKSRTLDADARTAIYKAGAGLAYSEFS